MKKVGAVCLVFACTFAMLALTLLPPDRADVGSPPEVEVIYDPALPEGLYPCSGGRGDGEG